MTISPQLPFGRLTPLLAPRSVAVVGASDRDGNLGGVALRFLRKFGFAGPIWAVNPGRTSVDGLPCHPSLDALPEVPDLAILAVPAEAIVVAARACIAARVPAAVAWAGGFAEQAADGVWRQHELVEVCRAGNLLLCGPNCIGVINTGNGLTASFSSMLYEHDHLVPGCVSMVSQSGGIAVMAHSRAQSLGFGFRVMASVGNEAVLGVADFIHALAHDDGTRVIAVYAEGLSNPDAFIGALAAARDAGKPVVVLKGGASEASGRAALAHTGRLAGADAAFNAVFREFAAIRVHSTEELLDVCMQFASMRPGQLVTGNRVLISSFGGGSGVIATDQCVLEGLRVPPLDAALRADLAPLLTPLSSTLNPVDLTPGMMTNPTHRAQLPAALRTMASADGLDAWMFMAAGFGPLAPQLVDLLAQVRDEGDKPIALTWQAMPAGVAEALAARGLYAFGEHARAARALGHLVRHAADQRHRIHHVAPAATAIDWSSFVDPSAQIVSEHVVARILEGAQLPVARGRLAHDADDAVRRAHEVGYPVAIKGISPSITHRAAVGLVALSIDNDDAVRATEQRFRARATELGVALDGIWVQHMAGGERELIVTALRDAQFGVMVGAGIGGGLTEVVDDVLLARAPIDADGAFDLIARLRTLQRLPDWLPEAQHRAAADFVARFSALAATAPWPTFTFEINPVKLGTHGACAVDGLLIVG